MISNCPAKSATFGPLSLIDGGEKVILIPPFLFGWLFGLGVAFVVGELDLTLTPLSTFLDHLLLLHLNSYCIASASNRFIFTKWLEIWAIVTKSAADFRNYCPH